MVDACCELLKISKFINQQDHLLDFENDKKQVIVIIQTKIELMFGLMSKIGYENLTNDDKIKLIFENYGKEILEKQGLKIIGKLDNGDIMIEEIENGALEKAEKIIVKENIYKKQIFDDISNDEKIIIN